MQKLIRLVILFVFCGVGVNSSAQTTIFNQSLLTQGSFDTFETFSFAGSQNWTFNGMYGAVCSGYSAGQNFENEDWLISPPINLSLTDNVKLTFDHTRGSSNVLNVGVAEGWYKVFVAPDFSGNPHTTAWTELSGFYQDISSAWQYITSGELVIPEEAKSPNSRIAFRYFSMDGQSATWEIKNVKVTGDPHGPHPIEGIFKITNWNTEWLGCTTFGPTDENLQMNNVADAMLAMGSDIYCIQEVTNSTAHPSIATLISLMGSDQWEGKIVPSNTDDCDQRQGIIYKKSKVQFVSATQLSSGNAAQGNSYNYNWAGGRYPAVYNVNLVTGNTLVPVTLVNIHAKAEDGNAMSYTRRLGASEALKTILDGPSYNTKNLILIGDFNDYLVGTTSDACACTVSPYQNFMNDSNYIGATADFIDSNTSWGIHPLIENMIISSELAGNFASNSVGQELGVFENTNNFYNTTSNHLPVSSIFLFPVLGNLQYTYTQSPLGIYPNPVNAELKFDTTGLENDATIAIYDVTGRQMHFNKINAGTIDVAALPSGVYILRVGNRSGRFVKQ